MPLPVTGQVGPAIVGDGVTTQPFRQGRTGEMAVSEVQGRFYLHNFRGNAFGFGLALTAINNATFTSATLGATCTPIIGIWNPINSAVNAAVLQATLSAILTALTATGPGGFAWYGSTGNQGQPSTGSKGINRFTFATSAKVQGVSGVALTGLTNNLVLLAGSALGGGAPVNSSQVYTVAGIPQHAGAVENIDGAFIVPPGGVLALLAQTTPVAHSVTSGILWNEITPTT